MKWPIRYSFSETFQLLVLFSSIRKLQQEHIMLPLGLAVLIIESSKVCNKEIIIHLVTNFEKSMYLKWVPDRKPAMAKPSAFLSISREKSNIPLQFVQPSTIRSWPSSPGSSHQTQWKPSSPKCRLRTVPPVDIKVDSTTFRSPSDDPGLLLRLILLKVWGPLLQASTSIHQLFNYPPRGLPHDQGT